MSNSKFTLPVGLLLILLSTACNPASTVITPPPASGFIPFVSRGAGAPTGRIENFLGMSGLNGGDTELGFAAKLGVGWVRRGISWASINSAPGVYDWSGSDALVANASASGVKLVLMIRDTPAWAAVTMPYDFTTPGKLGEPTPQHWTETPLLDPISGFPNGYTTRKVGPDNALIEPVSTSSDPSYLRMADPSSSWVPFIHALAERYAKTGKVLFFEIANEHRPESGQYPEDSVESVATRWFVPAAQELHRYADVRVMDCWGTSAPKGQIDTFDAASPNVLGNLDIYGQHYGDFKRWGEVFDRYQAKGKPNIGYWATEYGGLPADTWKVSHSYPAILGQVLAHDWSYVDKFKVFWWPAKNNTDPSPSLVNSSGEPTRHGRQVQALYSLLYGATLEPFTDFSALSAQDYAYGFRTDRGVVVALGLLDPSGAVTHPQISLTLPKIAPGAFKLARTVDAYGAIVENLSPTANGGSGSLLTVNTDKLSDAGMQMIYLEVQTK